MGRHDMARGEARRVASRRSKRKRNKERMRTGGPAVEECTVSVASRRVAEDEINI